MKKTEEVLPQYEFAEGYRKNRTLYRTSPAPFGGTLPKGEGIMHKNPGILADAGEIYVH